MVWTALSCSSRRSIRTSAVLDGTRIHLSGKIGDLTSEKLARTQPRAPFFAIAKEYRWDVTVFVLPTFVFSKGWAWLAIRVSALDLYTISSTCRSERRLSKRCLAYRRG
jgi:hypothetical protein